MGIKEDITAQMTKAVKMGDRLRLSTLRMAISALKYEEIEKRRALTEEEILSVLSRLAKQRRESIEEFRRGNRADLVEKEEKELEIIKSFMPPELSAEEILAEVKVVARQVGAAGASDAGKLIKGVMAKLKGRADGRKVQEIVKNFLSG